MTSEMRESLASTTVTLTNGVKVPMVGIGTSPIGGYKHDAIVYAIRDCGIRHIDTARLYGCEGQLAMAIKESAVPREELFIVSKVWPTQFGYDGVTKSLKTSLKELCIDYVDMYLLHWPICPEGTENPKQLLAESWKALEECYQQGLCKSIGVSNFEEHHLNDLKETWTVVPHMNQIELHILNYPKKLVKFCKKLGINITCYCPLGQGKVTSALTHPDVTRIAEEHHCTPAQVLLRWQIQNGLVTIPKSTNVNRVRENSEVFHFKLTDKNMVTLNGISDREFERACILPENFIDDFGQDLK